jgi:nucleoside-diphosphate-sugar epimerase
MKILVIGGTNFIGLNVVLQLIEMGHEVTVFNRGESETDLPREVKWIKGDRHNLLQYKVARAIALAVNDQRATGRIYNVSESTITVADLVRAIASIIGWQGAIIILPQSQMPDTWKFEANFDQYWVTDSTRIRTELGYTEIVDRREALRQTIIWEREHPPEAVTEIGQAKLLDYQDEDAILAKCCNSSITPATEPFKA